MFNLLRASIKCILENPMGFDWSLQGLGLLRLYFSKEYRLHIWDKRFAYPGASPIHDHIQWDFESTIISGSLTNVRYTVHPEGVDYFYQVIKAGYGAKILDGPHPIKLQVGFPELQLTGCTYHQTNREIHETRPQDGTVTLLRRTHREDGESARVFWRAGEVWGSAEPRKATYEEVRAITGLALERWVG